MINRISDLTPNKAANLAGWLYLAVIICGIFAEFFVRSKLIVATDASLTANNILASQTTFRIAFMSDLIAHTCYFLLAWALYVLLKPLNKNLALLFLLMVSISVAIMCLNMLNHFAALLLLEPSNILKAFTVDQRNSLVLFFMNLHKNGYSIAQIFFGGWLLPLGFVVYKSNIFPKLFGVLLMLAAFGHLIEFFVKFLFPNYIALTYPGLAIATIGEIGFCLWLIVRGVKIPPSTIQTN